jgi:hypothetical protein
MAWYAHLWMCPRHFHVVFDVASSLLNLSNTECTCVHAWKSLNLIPITMIDCLINNLIPITYNNSYKWRQTLMYHHLDFNNCMYVPYIFTKLLRPLIRHWRGLGISTTIFLEVEDNRYGKFTWNLPRYATIIKSGLCMSGLVANDDKSIWVPTQNI